MKKQLLKSNSSLVVMGDAPAWKTTQDFGRLMCLVQSCDFSIENDRQKTKQLGSQSYAINDITRAPQANLSMNYYLTPYMNNELLLGFYGSANVYEPALRDLKSRNQNAYIIVDTEENRDGFDLFRSSSPQTSNFSGFNALSFGNCYLNKYSVAFAVNTIPVVNVGLSSSNVRFESLTGSKISIPAINSVSGNSLNSGFFDLSGLYQTLTGGYIADDQFPTTEYNPPVTTANHSQFVLQDLQCGGVGLSAASKPILQSFNLDLDLARTDLYGLGSNYVYDRKLEFPANGQVQISCLVSGIDSGNFNSMLTGESNYSLEVSFADVAQSNTGFYKIEGAKLDNISYAMQVNGEMSFNASFSFQANETGGFFTKRRLDLSTPIWGDIPDLWQSININWSSL